MTVRKTHFATKKAFENRTPTWARNMFKITVGLTSVATFIIASDPHISAELAIRIGVYLKGFDLFMGILAETFGVTYEKINQK